MTFRTGLASLVLAVLLFSAAWGSPWPLFDDNLYPWKSLSLLDGTDAWREEQLAEWGQASRFPWEWASEKKEADKGAVVTLYNTASLFDIDVFYGREGFPEGRRLPLFQGNNYNLTFNGTPLYSDDYLYRTGSVRDKIDLLINKETEDFRIEAELSVESGENFENEGASLSFDHLSVVYEKGTRLTVGKITPFFGPYLLDKKDEGIAGFEVKTTLGGVGLHFVAARPDVPLDFTQAGSHTISLDRSQWESGDVIYHFPKPFDYFEVEEVPAVVYEISESGGDVLTRDITSLCTITHSDVIIPAAALTPGSLRVEIRYTDERSGARQQMYINAFNLEKEWPWGLSAAVAYVDLHNDTHSVENTQGLRGPLDSNIWSFRASFEKGLFRGTGQYAVSKIVPDDNLYDDREIDFIAFVTGSAGLGPLLLEGEYARMGADFLPNVLSLRDKWKLYTDREGDFTWNYEEEMPLGVEGVRVRVTLDGAVKQSVTFSRMTDLESRYMQNDDYASYDRFYLPYYSPTGNEYRLYGEGISDGQETTLLSWNGTWKNLSASVAYTSEKDDDLVVSPLKKQMKSVVIESTWENSFVTMTASYEKSRDKIYFSPEESGFVYQNEDETLSLKGSGHYKIPLPSHFALKLLGEGEYVKDADSIFEEWRALMFRERILPFDRVDEDLLRLRYGYQLFYQFHESSYLMAYYQREESRGENSLGGASLDYYSYERGIKFFSDFGEEKFRFAAFYDEYELRFSHWSPWDYSYKRIGALLEMRF